MASQTQQNCHGVHGGTRWYGHYLWISWTSKELMTESLCTSTAGKLGCYRVSRGRTCTGTAGVLTKRLERQWCGELIKCIFSHKSLAIDSCEIVQTDAADCQLIAPSPRTLRLLILIFHMTSAETIREQIWSNVFRNPSVILLRTLFLDLALRSWFLKNPYRSDTCIWDQDQIHLSRI
jgi:hypothetical protein